jgi:hypothetical protein
LTEVLPLVPFEPWPALLAGFVGTVVMSAAMGMARLANMTRMPPFPLILGTMVTGDRRRATLMGAFAHYVVMGTVVFGLAYAALFRAFDSASWAVGLGIGVVHGLIVGVMAMPMMPAMHPRMERAVGAVGGDSVLETGGEVRVSPPGLLGARWGPVTPLGVLVGHMIYGVVVALVYGWLV